MTKPKLVLFLDKNIGLKFLKFLTGRRDVEVVAVFSSNLNIMNYCNLCPDQQSQPAWYATDYDTVRLIGEFDFLFSIQYPYIIPEWVIKKAKKGAYNLHYSLLPKNRGMYPVTWAILNKERYHGATLHKLTKKIDAGDVILQRRLEIGQMNARQLYDLCEEVAYKMLTKNFSRIISCKIKGLRQNESEATYHDRFSIDFNKEKYLDTSLSKRELKVRKRAFYFPPYQVPMWQPSKMHK